jgi:hypothetical protein
MADEVKTAVADPADTRIKDMFNKLWNDRELGSKVRAKAKEQFPDIELPEDALAPALHPMQAQLEEMAATNKALLERIDARDKAEAEAKEQATLDDRLSKARSRYSLNEDGFNAMVERMRDTANYTDAEAAAAWVVSQQPPPPTNKIKPSWMPQSMNLFGSATQVDDEQFRLLHRDPLAYLDSQLQAFVTDPDGYTNETFGQAA